MSRSNKAQARQTNTLPEEKSVEPVGQADASPAEVPQENPVKGQSNDQTSIEPGKENATVEQIEARKDVVLNQEPTDPVAAEVRDPEAADDHQLLPAVPAPLSLEEEALLAQAEREDQVRDAFIAETRRETLDKFRPQRVEDVRIVVETNTHLDRAGDNVREAGERDKIVISDGVDEARMIDVQPEGTVSEEIDLGNGIKQTNLK